MPLQTLTISSAHKLLLSKQLSVPELVKQHLDRIEAVDPKIHAFLRVQKDNALMRAQQSQKRYDAGSPRSSLDGIPMGHKDLFCVQGVETTAGSNILKGYVPPYSATTALKLEEAGAIMLGKLNQDAFGHGSSTENSDFGPTKNPYNLSRVPGGSSGGSGAAVAASEVLFATGTDTGSSIRLPAAFTNTVGLKPTYGRVSRYGVIAMASSLDCPGPITKTVEDCALVMETMAGHDEHDATSSTKPVPQYSARLATGVKNLKIGVLKEFFSEGLHPQILERTKQALAKLELLGAKLEEVSLPSCDYALAVYYILMTSEVSSNLARYDGIKYGYSVERQSEIKIPTLQAVYEESRRLGFGAEAKLRIMLGTFALSSGYYDAYYKKALQARELIRQDFIRAFERCDLIAGPVSPTPPFKIGEKTENPLSMYLSDIYMTPINLAGVPAMSVPCGFVDQLPVGLQLIAPHFAEERLLQAAYAYEQATRFYEQVPNV
ncbi:MAG: glutaminyl-tRNA synthase (glutamine-hydrolyzing) subunit A [Candidatus Doudnabacteria bacterium RIFCSPHIGHO2_01_FULL_50_11]|uniref:Glutamyl-tRNA(Gln) amidotransferase subunit A n=1 Tax=Candidatus Doudnabacteria bacterium RIFCSPHIGHO2_01_FULL_50_11 TaxID=1817828 RepID=A0A1F5PM01_9BACT|nr:MAG: glutaminyl-tRNA synthase (glutamine-hydrolyzing) subunit A [Candidatus Doudnabacteria bacterium RIFCSPHIGHO2_01_FULL_50_11]HLC45111.1 Asp-tRNA(Asn)/Glu-tRNA(Gln) amidotransferase subunit GatA [Patescibacteria group bacterium]